MRAYRCGHSGKYLPPDYIKEWGKKYGIGLGNVPVSECVDSQYGQPPPKLDARIRSIDQIMHPVTPTFAQVDLVDVSEEEFETNRLITRHEDPRGEKRAALLLEKQLDHRPRAQMQLLRAEYTKQGGR